MSIFKAAVAAALAAAIAAAAYAVYSNWEPISEFFSELCVKIGAGFSAAWAGIRDGFAAALNFVRSGVDWLWSKIAPLMDALKKLKAWWSGDEAPAAQPAANAPAAAAAPGYAVAVPALSAADLESMSRAARERRRKKAREPSRKGFADFFGKNGGANQDRTDDLFNAIEALYQLSYDPKEINCKQ